MSARISPYDRIKHYRFDQLRISANHDFFAEMRQRRVNRKLYRPRGISFGSPSGAPPFLPIDRINSSCSSVRPLSLRKSPKPFTAPQGGICRCKTSSPIDFAQGRASSLRHREKALAAIAMARPAMRNHEPDDLAVKRNFGGYGIMTIPQLPAPAIATRAHRPAKMSLRRPASRYPMRPPICRHTLAHQCDQLFFGNNVDAAVFLPAGFSMIRADRILLAVAHCIELPGGYAHQNQIFFAALGRHRLARRRKIPPARGSSAETLRSSAIVPDTAGSLSSVPSSRRSAIYHGVGRSVACCNRNRRPGCGR